jgi:hypothetical protein
MPVISEAIDCNRIIAKQLNHNNADADKTAARERGALLSSVSIQCWCISGGTMWWWLTVLGLSTAKITTRLIEEEQASGRIGDEPPTGETADEENNRAFV